MKLRKRIHKNEASWVIDYYDRSGKRQRYTLKDIKTKKNAELAFAQFSLKYERQEIDLPTEDDLTLEKAIEALIENRRLSGCSSSWTSRLRNCRDHLLKHFSKECRIVDLNEERIAEYRIKWIDEGFSVETVNKDLKCLMAAGRLAIKQKKLARLPWEKVDLAIDRTGKEAWGYLSDDEITRLFDVLLNGKRHSFIKKDMRRYSFTVNPSPRLWAIVTFLLNTGARKGEMFALRWSDVNFETRMIRLIGFKSAKNGKSAKARYIPMNSGLDELFATLKKAAPDDQVFPMQKNLRKKFSQALKWANVPYYRIHDMRHTFASHLAMNGVPLYTISKLLGHSSLEMTQRYAHLAPDTLASAVQSLDFAAARPKDIGEMKPDSGTPERKQKSGHSQGTRHACRVTED